MEAPRDLASALEQMAQQPGVWTPFAGGTDLMVLLEAGKLPPGNFLSIFRLAELCGISVTPEHVTLGAATTYTQVRNHPALLAEFPLLCSAAELTGSIATQNRGTLGGNMANASPAADSPPALLVYDAELEIVSVRATRWIEYKGFHTGYKRIDLRPDELIRSVRMPRNKLHWKQHYRKVGTRRAQAISKVCLAAAAQMDGGRITDVRVAFGSIAPTVVRAIATEQLLRGASVSQSLVRAACETVTREIAPIDDLRSTAHYRRVVAQNLLAEFLDKISA